MLLTAFIFCLWLCCSCDDEGSSQEGTVKIKDLNARAVISPGLTGQLEGSTMVVPENPESLPLVRSFPAFSGVENPGQIGIGSALGFESGERVVIPVNVNLGTQVLDSYTIRITIGNTVSIQVAYIQGSFTNLHLNYTEQYDPAPGFEVQPQYTLGQGMIIEDESNGNPASGRINLFNLAVDIMQTLPPQGVNLTFEIISLRNTQGQDLCAILACQPIDGIVIKNFVIR